MRLKTFLKQARQPAAAPAGQSSRDELIESWGGGRQGRVALARRLAGLKGEGKLPKKGSKARHRYDAAMRALQRQAGGINPKTGQPRQTRAGSKTINRRIERLAAKERRTRQERRMRDKGLRVNVHVRFQVSEDRPREKDFDAYISGEQWQEISDMLDQGDEEDALDTLSEAIVSSADYDEIGLTILDIDGQITPY